MSICSRHNLRTFGPDDARTIVFAHGYGCDQNMWRFVAPTFSSDYRVVLFDLAGCGRADPGRYDPRRHCYLEAYAEDLCDLLQENTSAPVLFVGHSISAMIGALAAIRAPELFDGLIMVGPSPCYLNDGDYRGGFERGDIDTLLDLLDGNHHAWAARMAPIIMGNPDRPHLAAELEASFCRMMPHAARIFARVTFTSDCRAIIPILDVPTLILQSSDDAVAPLEVGMWVANNLRGSTLIHLGATGHCPHVSAPAETARAIRTWLE